MLIRKKRLQDVVSDKEFRKKYRQRIVLQNVIILKFSQKNNIYKGNELVVYFKIYTFII